MHWDSWVTSLILTEHFLFHWETEALSLSMKWLFSLLKQKLIYLNENFHSFARASFGCGASAAHQHLLESDLFSNDRGFSAVGALSLCLVATRALSSDLSVLSVLVRADDEERREARD